MRGLRTVAVVLAGGVGSRLGLDVPKQMVKIAGKTILEHTVEARGLAGLVAVYQANLHALLHYHPGVFGGGLTLVRTAG